MLNIIEAAFRDHPALIQATLILIILHSAFGALSKMLLQAAAFFGKIKKPWAKPIGKIMWYSGRICMVFGSGVPERYLEVRYQRRAK